MRYDADEYLAGLTPPMYRHHGCTYFGRHLSFDQWVVLTYHIDTLARMLRQRGTREDVLAAAKSLVQFRTSMRRIVDAVFPKRGRVECDPGKKPPRRGWIITRPARVSDLIEELPLEAQIKAVEGFIRSQERIQRATTPVETTTPTSPPNATGSDSTTTNPSEDDPPISV